MCHFLLLILLVIRVDCTQARAGSAVQLIIAWMMKSRLSERHTSAFDPQWIVSFSTWKIRCSWRVSLAHPIRNPHFVYMETYMGPSSYSTRRWPQPNISVPNPPHPATCVCAHEHTPQYKHRNNKQNKTNNKQPREGREENQTETYRKEWKPETKLNRPNKTR